MPTPKFDPRVRAYSTVVLGRVGLQPSLAYRPLMARAMRSRNANEFCRLSRAHASAQAVEHVARTLSKVDGLHPAEARQLLAAITQMVDDSMAGMMPVAETAHPIMRAARTQHTAPSTGLAAGKEEAHARTLRASMDRPAHR